ncbi:MAG: hypothetical protein Q4D04_14245 [Clostridia bacterium]|nr:hypothetical protein [Clostridia bacterium]
MSDMDDALVKRIFIKLMPTAQEAYDAAREKLGSDATVIAMPYGGSTLPRAKE